MELYGSIQSISGSMTASVFTGSFKGDGSGLYGISATGVTGLNLSQISTGSVTASVSPNGFNINSDTSITGTLRVNGTIVAEQIDVTIYSSSVLYQSGSTRFGDSLDDDHNITGSVKITGSISLNGQAIGTGKLDETTFQSYTSSNDDRVSALETSSGSLNSFTSSIDTTIKNKLNTEGVISGSIQVEITGTTGYSTFSSSIATTDLNQEGRLTSLEFASSSIRTDFNSYTSSNDSTNTTQNNRLGALETSSGSLNSFTSSIDTTIKSKLNTEGVVSGSLQVLNNSNLVSSSAQVTAYGFAITGSNLFVGTQTLSGSILPSVDNEYDLGSPQYQWRDVYISSGSLYIDGTKVISSTTQELQITTDSGQSIKILEGGTDSIILQTADGDIELKSNADGDILLDPTNGKILLKGTVEVLSGNKIQSSVGGTPVVFANDIVVSGSIELTGTIDGIDLTAFSSSVNTRLSNLESSGESLNSFTSSASSRLSAIEIESGSVRTNLNSYTSSTDTRLSSIETTTGSIITTNSQQTGRLDSIEEKTGSYATTGSNRFNGNQTITGSLTITDNLSVLGSSSIIYSTASQLIVEDNVIVVNASYPAERFAGLEIHDSGSNGSITASLFWDGLNNRFIYRNTSDAHYGGAMFIGGPRNTGSLGDEPSLTSGRIPKSIGGDHIGDSIINETNGSIGISGSLVITGSILSTGTPLVSGSSQISFNGITDKPTLVSGSSQISFNTISDKPTLVSGSSQISYGELSNIPSGIVSGSLQITFNGITDKPTLVSGSAQIDLTSTTNYSTGIKTRLSAENVLSSSAQVVTALPAGTVSGSSQISYGSVSNIPSGIVSGSSQISFGSISSIPSGLVSGSSQITLSSTTGFGTYLNQAVLTTSTPTFAELTISSNQDGKLTLRVPSSGDTNDWNYINFVGANGTRDMYFGTDSSGNPSWYRDDNGVNIALGSVATVNGVQIVTNSGSWAISITGNANTATTAGALTSMNISQFTNNSGYITGISFANVSSKPTTISGYGITDAITTSNISSQSVSNASTVANLTPAQFFNNMGANHGTRTSFDASTPSYDFGFRYVQGSTNGPGTGGSQFYSWYIGLGNDYPATGSGSYGAMFAVDRNVTTPYLSVRYNENNSFGSWRRIHAGYADTAGTAGNISSYTINQNLGTSNSVKFGSHCDLNISNSAFRFYDGSTFRGGLGLDDWAHSGSAANITLFAAGVLHFTSGGSKRAYFDTSGHLLPQTNNTYNLGSASLGWANVYTNDLHLSNMNKPEGNDIDGTSGSWTIQEGAENLYIINNNNGKKFKISLEEII